MNLYIYSFFLKLYYFFYAKLPAKASRE